MLVQVHGTYILLRQGSCTSIVWRTQFCQSASEAPQKNATVMSSVDTIVVIIVIIISSPYAIAVRVVLRSYV